MFFEKFPLMYLPMEDGSSLLVTDFLRAMKIDPQLKLNELLYNIYTAKDGETPEIISHKVYKSTQYHWVIMLLNEKFDPWRDFPQSDANLIKMAMDLYPDINAIHHYEDGAGNWVDEFTALKTHVTCIEYERQLNEEKREVKILRPELLAEFITQYRQLIVK